jgi:hypothetical protein
MPPFRCTKDYAKSLSWSNYIMVGPLGQLILFNFLSHLIRLILSYRVGSPERAESLLRGVLFNKMNDSEMNSFEQWRVPRGLGKGQFERRWGRIQRGASLKPGTGFLT